MDINITFIIELVVAFLVLVIGIVLDQRMRVRINGARKFLENKNVAKVTQQSYFSAATKSYSRTLTIYFLAFTFFIVASIIAVDVYTRAQEPRAELLNHFMFSAFFYGPILLAVIFIAGILIARVVQTLTVQQLLRTQTQTNAVMEAYKIITPRVGEVGVMITALIAIVASVASGAIILALLFAASQSAIECARSAKCM